MRSSLLVAALCAPSALAFPWMTPEGMEALLRHPEARQEIDRRLNHYQAGETEKRQLGTGLLSGVVTLLGGTLEAVVDNVLGLIPTSEAVEGLQKFPEGAFPHSTTIAFVIADLYHSGPPFPGTWYY